VKSRGGKFLWDKVLQLKLGGLSRSGSSKTCEGKRGRKKIIINVYMPPRENTN
jgi:hypothetical protein